MDRNYPIVVGPVQDRKFASVHWMVRMLSERSVELIPAPLHKNLPLSLVVLITDRHRAAVVENPKVLLTEAVMPGGRHISELGQLGFSFPVESKTGEEPFRIPEGLPAEIIDSLFEESDSPRKR